MLFLTYVHDDDPTGLKHVVQVYFNVILLLLVSSDGINPFIISLTTVHLNRLYILKESYTLLF
jgi:hypothetical protein